MNLDGKEIGEITWNSITFFRKSIAMAIIDRDEFELGKELLVQVRKDN